MICAQIFKRGSQVQNLMATYKIKECTSEKGMYICIWFLIKAGSAIFRLFPNN